MSRNWYSAICEDLNIDLVALQKSNTDSTIQVHEKSLKNYRDEGNIPKKSSVIKDILTLIQLNGHADFTLTKLQEYFDGKHSADPAAFLDAQHATNIRSALQSIIETGISLRELSQGQPTEPDPLSRWIVDAMKVETERQKVLDLLGYLRNNINSEQAVKSVRAIHDAVIPLICVSDPRVDEARQSLVTLTDADILSGAAVAGLTVDRRSGRPQSVCISTTAHKRHIAAQSNVIVESRFSAEDGDMKKRFAVRLLAKYGLFGENVNPDSIELSEADEQDLIRLLQISNESDQRIKYPLFLANPEDGKFPIEQLKEVTDIQGAWRFSNSGGKEVQALMDGRSSLLWIILSYTEIEKKQRELVEIEKTQELAAIIKRLADERRIQDLKDITHEIDSVGLEALLVRASHVANICNGSESVIDIVPGAVDSGSTLLEEANRMIEMLSNYLPG